MEIIELCILIAIIIVLALFLVIYYQRRIKKNLLVIEEQKKQMEIVLKLFDDQFGWYSVVKDVRVLGDLDRYQNILTLYFERKLEKWCALSVGMFYIDTKTDLAFLRGPFTQAVINTSPMRIAMIIDSSKYATKFDAEVSFLKGCGAEFLLEIIRSQSEEYKKKFRKEVGIKSWLLSPG